MTAKQRLRFDVLMADLRTAERAVAEHVHAIYPTGTQVLVYQDDVKHPGIVTGPPDATEPTRIPTEHPATRRRRKATAGHRIDIVGAPS